MDLNKIWLPIKIYCVRVVKIQKKLLSLVFKIINFETKMKNLFHFSIYSNQPNIKIVKIKRELPIFGFNYLKRT